MNRGTPEEIARQQLTIKLVQHKILDPAAQEATIQKILADSPAAVVAGLGDKSDVEKANELADAWFKAHGADSASTSTPNQKTATAPVASTLSSEEVRALDSILNENAVDKEKRLSMTKVVNVLTDKPCLYAIHVDGAMLTPNTDNPSINTKFATWEANLVDTPDNRRAFDELKTSYLKGDKMEVFINTDAKERTIGYTVETTDENGQPTVKILTKETAIMFLMFDVPGYVPARDENTSIGIKLRWQQKQSKIASDVESGSSKGSALVSLLNRKAMQNNKSLSVCTCQIKEVNGQKEINEGYTAKTAKYFEVRTDKKTKEGKPITRKVRLSGKTSVYAVQRIEKYAIFGAADGKKASGALTKAQREKQMEANRNALADFLKGTTGSPEVLQMRAIKRRELAAAQSATTPNIG